jgi:glycosyltransferase involved in cell wall biosynthesis
LSPSSITLLIPVYNEEATLDAILDRALSLERVTECVVVNDGSRDKSADVLKKRLQQGGSKIRVVTHPQNRGKGAAIRSGLRAATGEHLVIQDADAEYNPEDLNPIFDALERREAPVVYGSRFLRANPNLYRTYLIGNKLLTWILNVFGGGQLTDAYTCYKGMTLERWRSLDLQSDGFEIEAEITIKCLLSRWKILEVPIHYHPRRFDEGKKIRPSDAFYGVLTMFRYWLTMGLLRRRM